jgi:hypothetical protein
MEQQILGLIQEEVRRRVQLQVGATLERISGLYDIPMERLVKDTANLDMTGCRGVLATGARCLKIPGESGFCKFHTPGPTCKGCTATGKPCRRKAFSGFCTKHADQAPADEEPELKAPWET